MSKNIFRICYFCILFSALVACNSVDANWNDKYPFKIDFYKLQNMQLPGFNTPGSGFNPAYALSIVPDEDITIYGLRVEGYDGSWDPGKFVYEMKNEKSEAIRQYPYTIKKGDKKIIYQTAGNYTYRTQGRTKDSNLAWVQREHQMPKYDVMKIYTDKGTWLINIAMTPENLKDKKFKAKESNDKFDKEKNESYLERITKK